MYFITGSSGFVGSRLINALKMQSSNLRLLSRNNQPGFDTIICDLQSEQLPKNSLKGVHTIFHLAGFAHDMRNTDKIKHLYEEVNLGATIRLANLAAASGVKRFVFLSTVKAGGEILSNKCMSELDQNQPKDIYGKTKRDAELKLMKIGESTEMNISIIRSSLIYGPGMKGNLRFMMKGIEQGWFPPLPKIGNRRSMIHVDDIVRGLMLVASDDRAKNEIFIVTDGVPYSSNEIYNSMCSVLGKKVPGWSIPRFVLKLISLVSFNNRHKINKLFNDEFYSSKKIKLLGFKPERNLVEMNETSF